MDGLAYCAAEIPLKTEKKQDRSQSKAAVLLFSTL